MKQSFIPGASSTSVPVEHNSSQPIFDSHRKPSTVGRSFWGYQGTNMETNGAGSEQTDERMRRWVIMLVGSQAGSAGMITLHLSQGALQEMYTSAHSFPEEPFCFSNQNCCVNLGFYFFFFSGGPFWKI